MSEMVPNWSFINDAIAAAGSKITASDLDQNPMVGEIERGGYFQKIEWKPEWFKPTNLSDGQNRLAQAAARTRHEKADRSSTVVLMVAGTINPTEARHVWQATGRYSRDRPSDGWIDLGTMDNIRLAARVVAWIARVESVG